MRVIMVTPGFYPIRGGTETMVRNLSMALNEVGIHTDVMTFNMDRKYRPKWKGKIEEIDDSTVFKIPAIKWLPMEPSARITLGINLVPGRFTHLLKQYDIVHFHEADLSFPFFSFLVKRPKIFHLHGIDVNFYKRYHLSRIILKHVATSYISITRQMKEELTELGIPKDKIVYLPNSVDTKLFHPQGEKEDDLLLFVGRITFIKGLHVLLKSLRLLKKSSRLMIIGPSDSDRYFQDMLKLVEKENQRGKHEIKFLGALDPGADIVKWYQKASIFIAPSIIEAFGVVLLEALSCETPVIATTVGGIPEIVQNHENGLLVPPNDPIKLAEAIQYLLDNKDVRTRMGREGRKCVTKNFSLEMSAKKLYNIYQKSIGH